MNSHDVTVMFLALGTLLALARVLGEVARRFRQPAILGELVAGILLGPTVLGRLAPGFKAFLFPTTGAPATFLQGFATLAAALFLLVAGMEVDLSTILRQGKAAMMVSFSGLVVPFVIGFAVAWFTPSLVPGLLDPGETDPLVFSLFFATALAITALPVIVKVLRDVGLFRTDLGMIIIAAAILDDLVGWIVFAMVLGLAGSSKSGMPILQTMAYTLIFAVGVLTVMRILVHRVLPWIQAYTSATGSVLGLALSLPLFCAAFTEWIGVHAIFGAFLAGVALGDSKHLRERTRATIDNFVSFVFAPIFFATIGLQVDFVSSFAPVLTLLVIVVACLGKIGGCVVGARLIGMPKRDAWAIGFGMNARGAMEIILGLIARREGIIGDELFVALVIMAILTSMASGPVVQAFMRRPRARRFAEFLSPRAFRPGLEATTAAQAISELARLAEAQVGIPAQDIERAALEREELMPTGLEGGVAVPHARLAGLKSPMVAVGLSTEGIDFNTPDGKPARLIFLILTPEDDSQVQLEIIGDVARSFSDAKLCREAVTTTNFTQFLALVRTAGSTAGY